jgi:hypothetical protein
VRHAWTVLLALAMGACGGAHAPRTSRVAVLDRRFASRLSRFPEVNSLLLARMSARVERVAPMWPDSSSTAADSSPASHPTAGSRRRPSIPLPTLVNCANVERPGLTTR